MRKTISKMGVILLGLQTLFTASALVYSDLIVPGPVVTGSSLLGDRLYGRF